MESEAKKKVKGHRRITKNKNEKRKKIKKLKSRK